MHAAKYTAHMHTHLHKITFHTHNTTLHIHSIIHITILPNTNLQKIPSETHHKLLLPYATINTKIFMRQLLNNTRQYYSNKKLSQ